MTFTLLDIAAALFVFFFALTGSSHGLVREVFGKLAFICALAAGIFFCTAVEPYFSTVSPLRSVRVACSFFAVFIIVFVVVKCVQLVFARLSRGEVLGSLDHALGFFFGAAEGAFFVCVFLVAAKAQPWFGTAWITDGSVCWQYLEPVLSPVISFVGGKLS